MQRTWDQGSWDEGTWDPALAQMVDKIMKIHVALNLHNLDNRQQLAKMQTGIDGCTNNTDITNPDPPLADCQQAHDAAQAQLNAIDLEEKKLQDMRIVRDQLMATAMSKHTTLGSCVETKAKKANDPGVVTKAGFELASAPAPIPVSIGRVMNLVLTHGDLDGTADASWNRDKRALSYEVQKGTDPNDASTFKPDQTATKSSCTLIGLTSGSKIWVRVRAKGKDNSTGEWSNPVAIIVP